MNNFIKRFGVKPEDYRTDYHWDHSYDELVVTEVGTVDGVKYTCENGEWEDEYV